MNELSCCGVSGIFRVTDHKLKRFVLRISTPRLWRVGGLPTSYRSFIADCCERSTICIWERSHLQEVAEAPTPAEQVKGLRYVTNHDRMRVSPILLQMKGSFVLEFRDLCIRVSRGQYRFEVDLC